MRNSVLRSSFVAVVVLGLFSVAPAADTRRLIQPEDFAAIRGVGDPQLSPLGDRIVYTVSTVDLAKDKSAINLWLASWDGAINRPLTIGDQKQSHPRWSPDGRWIAFLSSRADENDDDQLWLLPSDGGEAEKVTELKGGVDDFAWAPDSRRIVLVVRDPAPDAGEAKAREKKTARPIVIDRLQFKRDKVGYLTDRFSHLQLLSLATRRIEVLTTGNHDELFPCWSPDGREIAFMSKRGADPERTDAWSLFAIEPRPGAAERLIAPAPENAFFVEEEQPLAWSPDGQWLAFIHGGDPKLIEYATTRLAVVPAKGGGIQILTQDLDRNVERPQWTADSQSVLVTLEDDGAVHLARVPLAGAAPRIEVGGRRRVFGFSVASDRVAVLASTWDRPAEVFAADSNHAAGAKSAAAAVPSSHSETDALEARALRPTSKQNDSFLAEVRLAALEETKFKSADGTEIHGFLVHPTEPVRSASPALLRPHGGPQSQYDVAFDFEKQLFAANGYLVIVPNPRGSTGRGTDYSKAIFADWGHLDVQDDLAAVDDAVARGLADPRRLGVGGWSYGGIATNYLIASTTRFKAATSGASTGNVLAGYGTDQYVIDYEYELGPPWKNPETWQRLSYPFLHADRIKTPTLFLCGEKDFNVPLLNSEQMYQALRSLGVPTQLVIYPGQYHRVTKPSYILDRYRRYLAWYAKWLTP